MPISNVFIFFEIVHKYLSFIFLNFSVSKQPFLQEVAQPYDLPDGTPSFKDMQGNRNNRFMNPDQAAKNHILEF